MSALRSFVINGRPVTVGTRPGPERKWCKFCRAVGHAELSTATCDHVENGRRCGQGICPTHSSLVNGQTVCPHHDPSHGVAL